MKQTIEEIIEEIVEEEFFNQTESDQVEEMSIYFHDFAEGELADGADSIKCVYSVGEYALFGEQREANDKYGRIRESLLSMLTENAKEDPVYVARAKNIMRKRLTRFPKKVI
jgi:hypothetical protein